MKKKKKKRMLLFLSNFYRISMIFPDILIDQKISQMIPWYPWSYGNPDCTRDTKAHEKKKKVFPSGISVNYEQRVVIVPTANRMILTPETVPAWLLTSPAATAAGDGDESGDEVSDDTWGIWISCLMWRNGATVLG